MQRKAKSTLTPTAKLILAVSLIAIFVGAWQLWADTGKQNTPKTSAPTLADSLLDVKMPTAGKEAKPFSYTGFQGVFNSKLHIPYYVAWELLASETEGDVKRESRFYPDEKIDGTAEHYDYNYSGYDRGHMAPAGDMKWSPEAMHASFSTANICPQAKGLNTGAWKRLEEKCRTWAKADSSIIIICGPIITSTIREFIGDTRVAVPEQFFKVVLSPYANPPRAIAFVMDNKNNPAGMQQAAVSVDSVEALTGYDFFSALPDDIENYVEAQCDFPYWSTIKPTRK